MTGSLMLTPNLAMLPTSYTPPPTDRPYQIRGVRDIVAGLANGGRGQAWSACGTGKTRIAQWTAERLTTSDGVVVVVVPTVGLVGQTLREWAESGYPHSALAVCSDATVAEAVADSGDAADADDLLGTVEELVDPVTTDPDVVDAWLRGAATSAGQPRSAKQNMRVIVGTHASAHVVGEGLQKANLVADLLVIDEAHRTAGHREKRTMLLHDDEVLPARRRLYMTATPRIFTTSTGGTDLSTAVSMDDEAVFGPPLMHYPFSQAIDDGYLDDYRLAIIGVTKAEVLAVLRTASERVSPGGNLPSEHAAMVQAAITRAATDLDLRRILAFCPRIADAKSFATTFQRTVDALLPEQRPTCALTAEHVNGRMSQARRRQVLDLLAEPPDQGWTVVSNARCLSEGINVPAVDAVAFSAPKRSVIDIVQAIGRALRRVGDRPGVATIIVPILLADDQADGADLDAIDPGAFQLIWQVALGLRAHDDRFDAALNPLRVKDYLAGEALDRVVAFLPDGFDEAKFLHHLSVRLVRAANSPWWNGYYKLVAFKDREGHTNLPTRYITDDGFYLGSWLDKARSDYKNGLLAEDRIAALRDLDVQLTPQREAAWDQNFSIAQRYYLQHGHLRVQIHEKYEGANLGQWLRSQRVRHRQNKLAADRVKRLEAIGIEWKLKRSNWREDLPERLQELRNFQAEHHRLPVEKVDSQELVNFLKKLREQQEAGNLEAEVVDELTQLGMRWRRQGMGAATGNEWWTGYQHLVAFHEQHGHTRVAISVVVDDGTESGFALGKWVGPTRNAFRLGRIPRDRAEALERIGFARSARDESWEHAYGVAASYYAEHGHLDVPTGYRKDDVKLYAWLRTQRVARTAGNLSAERVAKLDALKIDWDPQPRYRSVDWTEGIADLRDYHADNGTLPIESVPKVGYLIARARELYRRGDLPAHVVAALEELGIVWDFRAVKRSRSMESWRRGVTAARRFRERHGHIAVRPTDPRDPEDPDFDLAQWLVDVRSYRVRGHLSAERIAELDGLGMLWNTHRAAWENAYAACAHWYAVEGSLRDVGKHHALNLRLERIDLNAWLNHQRAKRASLTEDQIAKLDALGMAWQVPIGRRQQSS